MDMFLAKILGLVLVTYFILFVLVTVHLDIYRNGERFENKTWAMFVWVFVFSLLGYMWYVLLGV